MLAQFQALRKQDHTAEVFPIERCGNASEYFPHMCERTGNLYLNGYSVLPDAEDGVDVNHDSLKCCALTPLYAADGSASKWELREQWDERLPPGISFERSLSDVDQAVIILFDHRNKYVIAETITDSD